MVHPRKTGWDGVKKNMKSFSLLQQARRFITRFMKMAKKSGGKTLTQVRAKNGH